MPRGVHFNYPYRWRVPGFPDEDEDATDEMLRRIGGIPPVQPTTVSPQAPPAPTVAPPQPPVPPAPGGMPPGYPPYSGDIEELIDPASGRRILFRREPILDAMEDPTGEYKRVEITTFNEPSSKPTRTFAGDIQEKKGAWIQQYGSAPPDEVVRKWMGAPEAAGPNIGIQTDSQTGRRYILNPQTGAFEWVDPAPTRAAASPSWKPGEYELQKGELQIALANLQLATERAEDARTQWQAEFDAGRDDRKALNEYNNALLDLQRADRELNRIKEENAQRQRQEDTQLQREQMASTRQYQQEQMGLTREQMGESKRQFEAQMARQEREDRKRAEAERIANLFTMAQVSGYIPVALLNMPPATGGSGLQGLAGYGV